MLNREVPLEEFDFRFSEEGLENPVACKEKLVTILRFLEKDIFPLIGEYQESLPTSNDIEEHPLRTPEEGRYFFSLHDSLVEFMEAQRLHVSAYVDQSTKGLNQEDSDYVRTVALSKLNEALAEIRDIAELTNERMRFLAESGSVDEVRTTAEEAIDLAGDKPTISVDRLMHE